MRRPCLIRNLSVLCNVYWMSNDSISLLDQHWYAWKLTFVYLKFWLLLLCFYISNRFLSLSLSSNPILLISVPSPSQAHTVATSFPLWWSVPITRCPWASCPTHVSLTEASPPSGRPCILRTLPVIIPAFSAYTHTHTHTHTFTQTHAHERAHTCTCTCKCAHMWICTHTHKHRHTHTHTPEAPYIAEAAPLLIMTGHKVNLRFPGRIYDRSNVIERDVWVVSSEKAQVRVHWSNEGKWFDHDYNWSIRGLDISVGKGVRWSEGGVVFC
jgi:hypothetical protein